jgi:hypothetical protein
MVDDEVDGDFRVHTVRLPTERLDGVPHGSEVDDAGDTGEVLEEDAGRRKGDLAMGRLTGGGVTGEGLDVGGADVEAVLVAEEVLEEELERVRNPGEVGQRGEGIEAVDVEALGADLED